MKPEVYELFIYLRRNSQIKFEKKSDVYEILTVSKCMTLLSELGVKDIEELNFLQRNRAFGQLMYALFENEDFEMIMNYLKIRIPKQVLKLLYKID